MDRLFLKVLISSIEIKAFCVSARRMDQAGFCGFEICNLSGMPVVPANQLL
jgi:hypothetical protein